VTTRDGVLEALRGAEGREVSGEVLAAQLGVSRVAVSKHVSALREAGYGIEAAPGSGYRLVATPDLPLPAEVALNLHSEFWTSLSGGGATESTNDDARAAARSGAPEGAVFLASSQSAGRGRLGREWVSPPGGVYLSVVLRPRVAPAEVSSLSLAVALGVAMGLERLGIKPRLKWPNDLLLGDGKLAGLLSEMSVESDAVEWVVAGVGVNVRRADGGGIAAGAAPATPGMAAPLDVAAVVAFAEDAAGRSLSLAEVAAAELDGIAEAYEAWRVGGFAALRAEYEARFALAGKHVVVRDAMGQERAAGEVLGVDDEGRLLVRGEDGAVQQVLAGEVTLRG
jgi:BirA family transcriptional regulator, biotin operon repressor / biotin---[acetyl-CoA-carboxylase] ligase